VSEPTRPTPSELTRFLDVLDRLNQFEAITYLVRGRGAFDRSTTPLPDPAAAKVRDWLKAGAP
jgi:hypothetical protein